MPSKVIVLLVVISPPPVRPFIPVIATPEWSMCSLATNPDKLSWFRVVSSISKLPLKPSDAVTEPVTTREPDNSE